MSPAMNIIWIESFFESPRMSVQVGAPSSWIEKSPNRRTLVGAESTGTDSEYEEVNPVEVQPTW